MDVAIRFEVLYDTPSGDVCMKVTFSDISAGLRAVHGTPYGTVSSTVVDFRLGRILGVVYVATLGNYTRLEITQELGLALERKIVRVVLGDL